MTEVNPPSYLAGGCYTAADDRAVYSAIVCEEGVAFGAAGGDYGDLEVVDGPGGLTVTVLSGAAFIEGDNVSGQGMYHVVNDGPVNLTLAGSDPTDGRVDLIVATISDATYGGTDEWKLQVITGQPSPAPVAPAVPMNSIPLASVLVRPNSAEIQPGDITDLRSPYGLCSGSSAQMVVYAADSVFSKSDYPGATAVRVRVQAAGGEGGSVFAGTGEAAGSGGGGGGYAESLLQIEDVPASVNVRVGAGGTGNGATGGNGGDSSFGTLVVAQGGQGGITQARDTNTARTQGGSGGSATAGQLLIPGGDGGNAGRISGARLASGYGGDAHLGGSVAANTGTGAHGPNGKNYGGGGAGASGATNPLNGGDGAPGVVIVEIL